MSSEQHGIQPGDDATAAEDRDPSATLTVDDLIEAVERGERRAAAYSRDRIVACPNMGKGEAALEAWRAAWPYRDPREFMRAEVCALLASKPTDALVALAESPDAVEPAACPTITRTRLEEAWGEAVRRAISDPERPTDELGAMEAMAEILGVTVDAETLWDVHNDAMRDLAGDPSGSSRTASASSSPTTAPSLRPSPSRHEPVAGRPWSS